MAHLNVEDGTGITLANSYVGLAEAENYHTTRGNTAWAAAATDELREEALVRALDYLETRFSQLFLGRKEFINIALAAIGHFSISASSMVDADTVTIGTTVYKFVTAVSVAFDVALGADAAASASNLDAAINLTGVAGTNYGTGTAIHPDVSSTLHAVGLPGMLLTAKVAGAAGNSIALVTFSSDRASFDTTTMVGGQSTGEQPLSFPRIQLFTRDGTKVLGVPEPLKDAQLEYALKALAVPLFLDPTQDATGLRLIRNRNKVGPIETELEYAEGQSVRVIRPIPAADRLLTRYLRSTQGLVRG